MRKVAEEEMSERQVAVLMEQTQAAVDDGWNPREHMTPAMFKFLEPLTIARGQPPHHHNGPPGGFASPVCNGAKIQLLGGRPALLMAIVLQVPSAAWARIRKGAMLSLVEKAAEILFSHGNI